MISFTQASNLLEIEDAYASINGDGGTYVKIPTSLRFGGGFGIHASFFQFFALWSRVQSKPILRLHSSAIAANGIATLAREPHGIAALYFAPLIEDAERHVIPTREGLAHAVNRIQAMQSGDYLNTMHGRGTFLACFAGAQNEFLRPFYSKGKSDSLRGREDFSRLTEQLVTACAPNAMHQLSARHIAAISNLVYELFRNTDEHAQSDEAGKPYHRNMRGLMVKYTSFSGDTIGAETAGEDMPQKMFMLRTLSNQKVRVDESGRPRAASDAAFLEMTVFDTGPGLVRRWLGKNDPGKSLDDIDVESEVRVVQQCFEQHATTKDSQVSGHGLSLVLSALKELNAFLRLRTGRVCLVQDFSALNASPQFIPKHWLRGRHQLEKVAGASYSIIIPLSRGAN
jgi:hypothetical protein